MIVTVFDFDDTLFPTSYLINMNVKTVKFVDLSESIKKLLNKALSVGHVYIITNGERDWVKQCIAEYLVDCDDILNRVHLLSTVNSGISNITSIKQRKIIAFDRLIGLFTPSNDKYHHFISFGDCMYDRQASYYIRKKIQNTTFVKNVKLISEPTLKELLREHNVILTIYNTLLMSNKHLDLFLTYPSFLPSNLTT